MIEQTTRPGERTRMPLQGAEGFDPSQDFEVIAEPVPARVSVRERVARQSEPATRHPNEQMLKARAQASEYLSQTFNLPAEHISKNYQTFTRMVGLSGNPESDLQQIASAQALRNEKISRTNPFLSTREGFVPFGEEVTNRINRQLADVEREIERQSEARGRSARFETMQSGVMPGEVVSTVGTQRVDPSLEARRETLREIAEMPEETKQVLDMWARGMDVIDWEKMGPHNQAAMAGVLRELYPDQIDRLAGQTKYARELSFFGGGDTERGLFTEVGKEFLGVIPEIIGATAKGAEMGLADAFNAAVGFPARWFNQAFPGSGMPDLGRGDASLQAEDGLVNQVTNFFQDKARDALAADPRRADSFLFDVTGALSSMMTFIAVARATGGKSLKDQLPKDAGSFRKLGDYMSRLSRNPATVMAASTGRVGLYEDAIEHGVDIDQARAISTAGYVSGAIQVMEAVRVSGRLARVMDKAKPGFNQLLLNAVLGGANEAMVDAAGKTIDNVVPREFWDEEREVFDGILRSAGAAGVAGFVTNFATRGYVRHVQRNVRMSGTMTSEQLETLATARAASKFKPVEWFSMADADKKRAINEAKKELKQAHKESPRREAFEAMVEDAVNAGGQSPNFDVTSEYRPPSAREAFAAAEQSGAVAVNSPVVNENIDRFLDPTRNISRDPWSVVRTLFSEEQIRAYVAWKYGEINFEDMSEDRLFRQSEEAKILENVDSDLKETDTAQIPNMIELAMRALRGDRDAQAQWGNRTTVDADGSDFEVLARDAGLSQDEVAALQNPTEIVDEDVPYDTPAAPQRQATIEADAETDADPEGWMTWHSMAEIPMQVQADWQAEVDEQLRLDFLDEATEFFRTRLLSDMTLDRDDTRVRPFLQRMADLQIEEGLTDEQHQRRVHNILKQVAANNGMNVMDLKPERLAVFGESVVEYHRNYKEFVSKIHKGARGIDVIEEISESYLKRSLDNGDVTMDDVLNWKAQVEQATGRVTHDNSETGVIEWFSDQGIAWFVSNKDSLERSGAMPRSLGEWLTRFFKQMHEIVMHGINLRNAIKRGSVDRDFAIFLDRATGQDENYLVDQFDRVAAEADIAAEQRGWELLAAVRQIGGIPTPAVVTSHRGEIETLREQMGSRWASHASGKREGASLDQMREALNEDYGFNFDSPNDLIDALMAAARGEVVYGDIDARSAASERDASFSIGRGQPGRNRQVLQEIEDKILRGGIERDHAHRRLQQYFELRWQFDNTAFPQEFKRSRYIQRDEEVAAMSESDFREMSEAVTGIKNDTEAHRLIDEIQAFDRGEKWTLPAFAPDISKARNAVWRIQKKGDPSRAAMRMLSFSIGELDTAHADAVERGDMETAQRLVDEAAMKAGYDSPRLFHGTESQFEFFSAEAPIFLTESRSVAQGYGGRVISSYASVENPIAFDFGGRSTIRFNGRTFTPRELAAHIKELADDIDQGISLDESTTQELEDAGLGLNETPDAIILNNIDDSMQMFGGEITNHTVVFHPNQIKSADAATYDSEGKLIPLSQRFNPERPEITFSIGEIPADARAQPTENVGTLISQDGAVLTEATTFSIGAWHGTPHKVDRFSTEKIGTGEGSQAYGYGLYFAGARETGEFYRRIDKGEAKVLVDPDGNEVSINEFAEPLRRAFEANWESPNPIKNSRNFLDGFNGQHYAETLGQESLDLAKRQLEELEAKNAKPVESGNLYQVNLKVEPEQLLDWDKPLSEQSEFVIQAIIDRSKRPMNATYKKAFNKVFASIRSQELSARDAYSQLVSDIGSSKSVSEFLFGAGIRGIRYLDGMSRPNPAWPRALGVAKRELAKARAGKDKKLIADLESEVADLEAKIAQKGSYNYVIFDDADIEIIAENGEPVAMGDVTFSIGEMPDMGGDDAQAQAAPQRERTREEKAYAQFLVEYRQTERPTAAQRQRLRDMATRAVESRKRQRLEQSAMRKLEAEIKLRTDAIRRLANERDRVTAAMRQLEQLMEGLPSVVKGRFKGFATLSGKKTEAAKRRFIEQATKRIDDIFMQYRRTEYKGKLARILDPYGNDNPARQRELASRVGEKAKEELHFAAKLSHREDFPAPKGMDAERAEYLRGVFGGVLLKNQGAERVIDAHDTAVAIRSGGRDALQDFHNQRKQRNESIRNDAAEIILRGDRPMDQQQLADESPTGMLATARDAASLVLFHGLNGWQQHMNALDGVKGGWFDMEFNDAVIIAEQEYRTRQREEYERLISDLATLFGTEKRAHDWMQTASDKRATMEMVWVGETGKRSHSITRMQGVDMLLKWGDKSLQTTFEAMGITESMIDQVRDFVGLDGQRLVRYLRGRYAEIGIAINEVHRETEGFAIDLVENYGGRVYRAGLDGKLMGDMADSMIDMGGNLEKEGARATVKSGSLKARMDSVRPMLFGDAFSMFRMHTRDMNHYMSHAALAKDLRAIFGSAKVRAAIEQKHGKSFLRSLDALAEDIINGRVAYGRASEAVVDNVLNRLRSNYSVAKLALSPAIAVKQLVSAPAFVEEIGADAYSKSFAEFGKSPMKWAREIIDTDYVRNRMSGSMYADIQQELDRARLLGGRLRLVDMLMLNIKFGDIGAVIMGGAPVYINAYNAALADGASDAEAKRQAELRMAASSERAQQSSAIHSRGAFLRGNALMRSFFAFMTSPIQYQRNVNVALYNAARSTVDHYQGKPSEMRKAMKQLFYAGAIYHVLLPQLFQAVSSGVTALIDDDDEDRMQQAWRRQLRALMLGNANIFPVLGQLLSIAANRASGAEETFLRGSGSPLIDGVGEIQRDVDRLMGDPNDAGNWLRLLQSAPELMGVPMKTFVRQYEALQDTINEETEHPLLRNLGWSKWAIMED